MALRMNVAVVEEFGKPLMLREWNIPSPVPVSSWSKMLKLVLRVYIYIHAMHGDWPVKPTLPFIPVHQAIEDWVAAVGDKASAM